MAAEFVHVDPKIWRVIAGPCSEFPTENSMVYYFPQGHVDEASAPLHKDLSHLITRNPSILCKVTYVYYLANKATDEVTAYLGLTPTDSFNPLPVPEDNNDRIFSYVKILESSEVPPFERNRRVSSCYLPDALAESMLPPMVPPIDTYSTYRSHRVTFTDLKGKAWNFTHYYYNIGAYGQKHVIREGWREFASEKRLLAGDAIVFVKKDSKIFVGIRRAHKSKVGPRRVARAIEFAINGLPFTVVYTPSPGSGWCDFVVRSHIVEESMSVSWWAFETRVMMALHTSAFSVVTLIRGTIRAISNTTNPILLPTSPFRAFLIEWDQPGITPLQWVSPWQLRPLFHVPYFEFL